MTLIPIVPSIDPKISIEAPRSETRYTIRTLRVYQRCGFAKALYIILTTPTKGA